MYGMKEYGMSSWSAIASHMDGQTADSCEKRWTRSFDPAFDRSMWTAQEDAIIKMVVLDDIQQLMSAKKAKWTKQEDDILLEAVKRHGTKDWTLIGSYLPQYDRKQCSLRYLYIIRSHHALEVEHILW